jgi:hypothetical protein
VRLVKLVSFCVSFSFLVSACKSDLSIFACLSSPEDDGFFCSNDKTGEEKYVPYEESETYIAFHPDELETLIQYYQTKCKRRRKPAQK